jgi:hypothetical protein
MLDVFFLLNKRYQLEIVDKLFELFRIHLTLGHIRAHSHQCELDMRLLHVTKKLVKQLVVDDFTIKMNKNTVHLIDRFNSIQKKRAAYHRDAGSDTFDDLVKIATEDDEDECA